MVATEPCRWLPAAGLGALAASTIRISRRAAMIAGSTRIPALQAKAMARDAPGPSVA